MAFRDSTRGQVVTHRVLATNVDPSGAVSYTTKGDANAVADSDPSPTGTSSARSASSSPSWDCPPGDSMSATS